MGLCINHHLLQIEASLIRVKRCNSDNKALEVNLLLCLFSTIIVDCPLGPMTSQATDLIEHRDLSLCSASKIKIKDNNDTVRKRYKRKIKNKRLQKETPQSIGAMREPGSPFCSCSSAVSKCAGQ